MAVDVDLLNSNSINNIQSNFERVQTSLQDAVSRSGNTPNHMNADLDMNSNDILNVNEIDADSITIQGLPIGQFNGTYKGLWSISTSYVVNDVVRDNAGNLWIAQQNNSGQSPQEGAYWTLFMPIPDGVTDGDKGDITVSGSGTVWDLNKSFDTVSELLADETMGYAGSSPETEVVSGDIVRANDFQYEVADSSAVDGHVETVGGVPLYLRRNADLTVYSQQAGIDASTTSAVAINKMLSDALAAGAHTVKFAPGEYEPDARIDWPVGLLEIDGQGSRWTRNIAAGSGWANSLLRYVDTLETLPALAADIDSTTEVIEFASPHGLEVNDVIGFRDTTTSSLNAWRTTYYDGQVTKVRSIVSDTEITVFDVIDPRGVLKVFPSATTEVCRYRKRSRGLALRNIEMVGNLSPFGLCRLEGMSEFELENISATGAYHTTMSLGLAAYGRSEKLRYNNTAPTIGNQYGLGHDAVSFHKVFDIVAYATRHAIAQGNSDGLGSLPPRGNQFFGVNLGSEVAEALDFGHGNILDCRVVGGTISSVGIGGENNHVDVDVISVPPTYFSGCRAIATTNLHGVNNRVRAGRIIAPGDGTHNAATYADGIIGCGGTSLQLSGSTVNGGLYDVEVGVLEARNWSDTGAMFTRWRNRGFTGRWGVRLRIGQIVSPVEADWFSMGNVSGTAPAILDLGPVAPDRFDPSGSPTHGWNASDRGVVGAAVVTGGDISAPPLQGSTSDAGASISAGTSRLISITGFTGLTQRDGVSFGASGALGGNFNVSAFVANSTTVAILVSNVTAGSLTLNALTWHAYVSKRP